MKKLIMILMIAVGASFVAYGQTKMSKDSKVEAQIIALEKAGWQAWKKNDAGWYQKNLADDALSVHGNDVADKAQNIKDFLGCEVKSFSLDDFKFVMIDKNAALITFKAMQDAVCGGKTQPSAVRASSVYVKRGGKWLNIYYTEIPLDQ